MKNCFDALILTLILIEQEFANKVDLAKHIPNAKSVIDKYTVALIIYLKGRSDHVRNYAVDVTKINIELGYQSK
jgi:hypothetical protein